METFSLEFVSNFAYLCHVYTKTQKTLAFFAGKRKCTSAAGLLVGYSLFVLNLLFIMSKIFAKLDCFKLILVQLQTLRTYVHVYFKLIQKLRRSCIALACLFLLVYREPQD